MEAKEEIFVDIKGYEGLYKISNHGRVYFFKNKYFLNPYKDDKWGHRAVRLYKEKKPKNFFVHRLVLIHFDREPLPGEECRHLDGNAKNNHIDNLCWGTHKENIQDKILHGTVLRGENIGNSKLTEEQVKEIRRLSITGKYFQRELAEMFNVNRALISMIINNKRWSHL